MRWESPTRWGRPLVCTVVTVVMLGASACTGDDGDGGDDPGPSSASGAEGTAGVTTVTTLQNVGKSLDAERRERVKARATELIDPWFDGAFLGEFPRSDYAGAFTGFTQGAAADAERDLDLLSNAAIADQIESATATRRRVRLDVFAPEGHPRGLTAHFVLEFTTSGDLEGTHRVRGDLYLARDKGVWKIFGYDVGQAAQL